MRNRRAVIRLATLAAVVALGTGCALFRKGIGQPPRKEFAVIAIGMSGGQCAVLEEKVSKIRTSFDHTVTWIVVGSCEGSHTVSIGEFTKGGKPQDPTVSGDRAAKAADGERIRIRVKARGQTPHGLYVYQVLIDGKPALVAASDGEDDPGEFDVCPEWPCHK